MKLYRAISEDEYKDFITDEVFRTAKNTLEAKQFFKSEIAVEEFVKDAIKRRYRPPYRHILTIDVDNQCFEYINSEEQNLDGHDAVTIQEDDLPSFNNCVTFIEQQNVWNSL